MVGELAIVTASGEAFVVASVSLARNPPGPRGAAVVNRGDVWWLEHPTAGRRPACILTRQAAIPVLNSVLLVPTTRTVRGIPTEVALGREDGMPEDCALSFDNLGVAPKALLSERITRLSPAKLAELCTALDVVTGC